VLLNLFDAFRLLTGVQGAEGLGQQQRQAMALAALDTFDAGFLLAPVLFGVQLLMSGFLLYRSRYLPRVFGALLVAAGVGYVADSLAGLLLADHGGLVSAVLLTPAVVGELQPGRAVARRPWWAGERGPAHPRRRRRARPDRLAAAARRQGARPVTRRAG
jgi:hypothetical protein